MKIIKSLVITGYGINCEQELAAAYKLAGAEVDIVHLNDVFLGKIDISDYQILNFPGGFSFGDDLGSGKVLANKMKYRRLAGGKQFYSALLDFIDDGVANQGLCFSQWRVVEGDVHVLGRYIAGIVNLDGDRDRAVYRGGAGTHGYVRLRNDKLNDTAHHHHGIIHVIRLIELGYDI